jgi:hypothetical protein
VILHSAMYSNASALYDGLKLPARCLAAVAGDVDRHRFLVGTCSLKETNELQLLSFQEDSNELSCVSAYSHPDEIWGIAPSPVDRRAVLTCHNTNAAGRGGAASKSVDTAFGITLWKLPQEAAEPAYDGFAGADRASSQPIEKVASLGATSKAACAMLWEPGGQGDRVVTVAGGDLVRWELAATGGAAREATRVKIAEGQASSNAASWDPHNRTSVAVAVGCALRIADTRTGGAFTAVSGAHRYACRAVDHNPHKPSCVITCGEDR